MSRIDMTNNSDVLYLGWYNCNIVNAVYTRATMDTTAAKVNNADSYYMNVIIHAHKHTRYEVKHNIY
jgi:hypothetical protein